MFAIISDRVGRKPFYTLAGLSSSICHFIYYLAKSSYHFVLGKIGEAVWNASLWSVNRAYVMEHSKMKEKVLMKMRGVTNVSLALGSLLVGILVLFLGYRGILLLCSILTILAGFFGTLLKEKRKERKIVRSDIKMLKKFLIPFFIFGISNGFAPSYGITLFLQSVGFNSQLIGVLMCLEMFITGITLALVAPRIKNIKLVSLTFPLSLVFLFILPSQLVVITFLFFGFGLGMSKAVIENTFPKIVDSKHYGRDIGILMMGVHVGNTISTALSGFVISSYGFASSFMLSALFFIVFLFSTSKLSKNYFSK
ncbi:MAG TPA: MFS transporter [Candidatus Aenigmarchaeota archaeon]|nr:MFS transporter [Candidatus Aenigmarchaeota archaeon]